MNELSMNGGENGEVNFERSSVSLGSVQVNEVSESRRRSCLSLYTFVNNFEIVSSFDAAQIAISAL